MKGPRNVKPRNPVIANAVKVDDCTLRSGLSGYKPTNKRRAISCLDTQIFEWQLEIGWRDDICTSTVILRGDTMRLKNDKWTKLQDDKEDAQDEKQEECSNEQTE